MQRKLLRRGALATSLAAAILPLQSLARIGPVDAKLLPDAQRKFAAPIDEAWIASSVESDERRRTEIFLKRGDSIRAALAGGVGFDRWICLMSMTTTAQAHTVVSVAVLGTRLGSHAAIGNLSFSDASDVRLLSSSPIAAAARGYAFGEAVLVSGEFQLDERRGFSNAYGMTHTLDQMEFQTPAFTVRFTALTQPAWLKDLPAASR